MSYSEEAQKYADSILEFRREINAQKTIKIREEIDVKCKGFTGLETYRRSLNLQKMKASLLNDFDKIEEINLELQNVSKEIDYVLKKAGFSIKDLEDHYSCDLCNDTGVLRDGSTCQCKISLMKSFELNKIQNVSPLALSSFDSFDLNLYSKDKSNGISAYDVMKDNYKECLSFAEHFPKTNNLLLMGRTGIGKTHLALSIANRLLEAGYEVIYCSCSNILQVIDSEKSANKYSSTLNSIKRCDLFILDDLGSEYINSYYNAILYDIVNSRLSESKAIIITTNLDDSSKIQARYGDKITSRIIGCFKILPCLGDDLRLRHLR